MFGWELFSSYPKLAKESNELSKGITEYIVNVVEEVNPNADFNMSINKSVVREYAHFFTYLVLGILVTITFKVIGIRGIRGMGLALLLCSLYAVSDEIHQFFSPGRGMQLKDVFVDSIGASVGTILVCITSWILKRPARL